MHFLHYIKNFRTSYLREGSDQLAYELTFEKQQSHLIFVNIFKRSHAIRETCCFESTCLLPLSLPTNKKIRPRIYS